MDTGTPPSAATTSGVPHRVAAAVGGYGEQMAERFLRERGLVILDRNWRCAFGEIDLVARDGGCLVVCEVKTRRGAAFGTPVEAVTREKLTRLRRLAAAWLAEHEVACPDVRVDVVGVLRPRAGPCLVEHLVGVG